mmetsp:Transcript_54588/g.124768  ORF Transcript_54588/g.124768 Transcript_54588/m.124768 type:complete len:204 (-) Transcript_54588:137-748(-)
MFSATSVALSWSIWFSQFTAWILLRNDLVSSIRSNFSFPSDRTTRFSWCTVSTSMRAPVPPSCSISFSCPSTSTWPCLTLRNIMMSHVSMTLSCCSRDSSSRAWSSCTLASDWFSESSARRRLSCISCVAFCFTSSSMVILLSRSSTNLSAISSEHPSGRSVSRSSGSGLGRAPSAPGPPSPGAGANGSRFLAASAACLSAPA